MTPVNLKYRTKIDFGIESNDKGPKFKVDDHVRISKFRKTLCKRLHYKSKQIVGTIYEKNCKKKSKGA